MRIWRFRNPITNEICTIVIKKVEFPDEGQVCLEIQTLDGKFRTESEFDEAREEDDSTFQFIIMETEEAEDFIKELQSELGD